MKSLYAWFIAFFRKPDIDIGAEEGGWDAVRFRTRFWHNGRSEEL